MGNAPPVLAIRVLADAGKSAVQIRVLKGTVTVDHVSGESHSYGQGDTITYPFPSVEIPELPTTVPDSHVTHRWTKWRTPPSLFYTPSNQSRRCVDCDLLQHAPIANVRP